MKEKRFNKVTFTLSDSERLHLDLLVQAYNSSGLRVTASDIIRCSFTRLPLVADSSLLCSL